MSGPMVELESERIEAARRRIVRVMTQIAEPEDSENERLLREALALLDPEVKFA